MVSAKKALCVLALMGMSVIPALAMASTGSNEPVMNRWGGEAYLGAPDLPVTVALVQAGGGAEHFSFAQALVAMLGQKAVNAEVAKLKQQYGAGEVGWFLARMDFAVKDGLKQANNAGVTLPAPAHLAGAALAKTLIQAGVTADGSFWAGHLFDVALSHNLHMKVMDDIDLSVGYKADRVTHQILNQAMFDVSQALGMKQVRLASLH